MNDNAAPSQAQSTTSCGTSMNRALSTPQAHACLSTQSKLRGKRRSLEGTSPQPPGFQPAAALAPSSPCLLHPCPRTLEMEVIAVTSKIAIFFFFMAFSTFNRVWLNLGMDSVSSPGWRGGKDNS